MRREGPHEPRKSRARFTAAYFLILASVFGTALSSGTSGGFAFGIGALVVGSLGWLLSVRWAPGGPGRLPIVIAGAILLRGIAATVGVPRSDDAYRYLWEGELVLAGGNPYLHSPADASAAEDGISAKLRDEYSELWSRVNHKEVRAAYPPLSLLVGAGAAASCRLLQIRPEDGGIRLLRAFFGLCDLLVIGPLVRLLDRARIPRAMAVVWAWSPLATIEFAGSAHLDSLAILLLVSALAASSSGVRSALLLAGGFLTKYLPVVALPWLARGRGARIRIAVFLGVSVLAFAPFILSSGVRGPASIFSGLGEYAFRWDSASLVHRFVEGFFARFRPFDESLTDPRRLARATEALAWLAFAIVRIRRDRDAVQGCAALIGAWIVLSPTLHPWYVCWMLPFLALRPSPAWSWLLCAAPLLDVPYVAWVREAVWREPRWLWPVLFVPFFALWIRARIRAGRDRAVSIGSSR
jgi:hypothetical protein